MSDFNRLKKMQRIKKIDVDKAKSRGLQKRAETRFANQKHREINDSNAFEILENTYESLREAIEAAMAAEGYSSEDHVAENLLPKITEQVEEKL